MPRVFGIEVVQGQEWLVQELKRTTRINVKALRPQQYRGKDKVGRASHVRSLFEQGRVWIATPTTDSGTGRLLEEMMAFPGAKDTPGWDDCVDSLIWNLLLSTQSRTRVVRLNDRSVL